MQEEIVGRVHEKVVMKQRKKRCVQIQRKLRSVVKAGVNIREAFKDFSQEKAAVVRDIISMNVLERYVVHVCYDKENEKDVV